MNKLCEEYHHRARVQYDASEKILFRWHWPRGTFDPRMSALELAAFVLPHMPSILPFFSEHPRVQAAWRLLLDRLVSWPVQVLDEVVPWIKGLTRTEEDDIVELDLGAVLVPAGPSHFVLTGVNDGQTLKDRRPVGH